MLSWESTYGGRFHKNTGDHVEEFARVIQETLDKGGNVVIPAFAVGRTQEVLNYIRIIKEKNLCNRARRISGLLRQPDGGGSDRRVQGQYDGLLQ